VTQSESANEFNSDKAELYETLAHPTRILILQTLSDHPMGFSELKRATNIESSGNLSFHLNKLGPLVKPDSEGNYGLTDEGREAIRVVEATERLSQRSRSEQGHLGGSKVVRKGFGVLVTLVIVLGILMIVTGPILASQSQLIGEWSSTSPTNFTLPPGGTMFWFGEGGLDIHGVMHLVYFGVASPIPPEFQITSIGAVNGTIYSTQSNYAETDYSIPMGTRFVNYTISNPTGVPLTVAVVYVRQSAVDYPNQGLGKLLLYLGTAIVIANVGLLGIWVLLGRNRRPNI